MSPWYPIEGIEHYSDAGWHIYEAVNDDKRGFVSSFQTYCFPRDRHVADEYQEPLVLASVSKRCRSPSPVTRPSTSTTENQPVEEMMESVCLRSHRPLEKCYRSVSWTRLSRRRLQLAFPLECRASCKCLCRHEVCRPGRLIQCPGGCMQGVGPGCCWDAQSGVCHWCRDRNANPQEIPALTSTALIEWEQFQQEWGSQSEDK